MNFQHRSYKKELLDDEEIPFSDIRLNMQELDTINTLLGGHGISLKGFKQLLGKLNKITICEIGCGGGDNLAAIVRWCNKRNIIVDCIGIDMKAACIEVAANHALLKNNAQWIISDYSKVVFTQKPDIIFSSLFCHHFTDEQLQMQLQWLKANSRIGFFINDLHRNKIAYYAIQILTRIFSKSYLVKNDAPLSVARGFLQSEWKTICDNAGLEQYSVNWKWAFRHLIIYKHVE
jgi:2-polyprenyl-3-methyl-5-hydroxy-6-metoxy-1,4-benzoquinol methylase